MQQRPLLKPSPAIDVSVCLSDWPGLVFNWGVRPIENPYLVNTARRQAPWQWSHVLAVTRTDRFYSIRFVQQRSLNWRGCTLLFIVGVCVGRVPLNIQWPHSPFSRRRCTYWLWLDYVPGETATSSLLAYAISDKESGLQQKRLRRRCRNQNRIFIFAHSSHEWQHFQMNLSWLRALSGIRLRHENKDNDAKKTSESITLGLRSFWLLFHSFGIILLLLLLREHPLLQHSAATAAVPNVSSVLLQILELNLRPHYFRAPFLSHCGCCLPLAFNHPPRSQKRVPLRPNSLFWKCPNGFVSATDIYQIHCS